MKVKTWIETEVEVEVSVEEAMAELCAMPDVYNRQDLVFVLNRCVAALRHVPDATLAGLDVKTRQIVADALRHQALRYAPPPSPLAPGPNEMDSQSAPASE